MAFLSFETCRESVYDYLVFAVVAFMVEDLFSRIPQALASELSWL
jgi:hypothetical protein